MQLSPLPDPKFTYITTNEAAYRALEEIEKYKVIEVDSETTGLDPLSDRVVLLQIGVKNNSWVFDVRDGRVDARIFKGVLESQKIMKILQNARFDYQMLKTNFDIAIRKIYDTMLGEQLSYLGLNPRANLKFLVAKYLKMDMPKDVGESFKNYNQEYQEYQKKYAANDVGGYLTEIYNQQMIKLRNDNLLRAMRLECEFVIPLAEMEIRGIILDKDKWNTIIDEQVVERDRLRIQLGDMLEDQEDQNTLFGVSLVNLDSPAQLLKRFQNMGIPISSTDVKELNKHKKHPIIAQLLEYRKYSKFVTTYGEPLLSKIHPNTGRLHTEFTQMVDTGRLSSRDPNLQNIPKEQRYRSCFVSKSGYKLITCDMSSAELRIIAAMSKEPKWVDLFNSDSDDLHSIAAADIFKVSLEEVFADKALNSENPNKKFYRDRSKPLSFGLAYGLTNIGLSLRLGITENEAQKMIDDYFRAYPNVKRFLDGSAKAAILNRYSKSISGRRRYYTLPDKSDPNFNRIRGSVERQAKNMPIQGCVHGDTFVRGLGIIRDNVGKEIRIETGFGEADAKVVYSGVKNLYELKLSNGAVLKITKDHKIPVCNDFGMEDKEVKDINLEKDLLMIPINKVEGYETDLSDYKYIKDHWRETYTSYKYPNKMDKKLAFIIGCLIGDGNYSKHNYIKFVCMEDQKELFDKFVKYVHDVFGYKAVINVVEDNRYKKLLTAQVSSVVIRGFLKHIGLDYVINRRKTIPPYFMSETIENKAALLDGLFSTDGGVTKESGPNFTTVSKNLAAGIQQVLFSIGINSNLKTYNNEYGCVYRIQIGKRFLDNFCSTINISVNEKNKKCIEELGKFSGRDKSLVPGFIPKLIYNSIYNSDIYSKLSSNAKAHLRRLKLGSCTFSSWRKFYNIISDEKIKDYLSMFCNYDFCRIENIEKCGVFDSYDVICKDAPHYFTANGVIVHNSNADTIKQAMIYVEDRLEGYDAKLILTVHDEVVIEACDDQAEEVREIVSNSVVDGFAEFFSNVPMKADASINDFWKK